MGVYMILEKNQLYDEYISVGTDKFTHELMQSPVANIIKDSSKPIGGVWATVDTGNIDSNFWLRHISERNLWNKFSQDIYSDKTSAVFFKLKDTAKIFYLKSYQDFLDLQAKYPIITDLKGSKNLLINYHELAKEYDGLLFSDDILFSDYKHNYHFLDWSVESLVIFNLDCVEYVRQSEIIKNGGYDYITRFSMGKVGDTQQIDPIDPDYYALYSELDENILKEIKTCGFENYHTDNYWSFMEELNTLLMCHLSNHPGLMNKMHDILNNRVLSNKILPEILQKFLVVQTIGKHYDYLNDVYQKKLIKGNK